jgi:cytochrome P450
LLRGKLPFNVHRLHEKYGEVVRIAPDELAYINADAWKDIYGHRSGNGEMPKNPLFYQNASFGMLSIIGAPGERHGQLRRLLSHGFSEMALKEQEPTIQRYADLLMERLHQFSDGGRIPLDMVKWYNVYNLLLRADLILTCSPIVLYL